MTKKISQFDDLGLGLEDMTFGGYETNPEGVKKSVKHKPFDAIADGNLVKKQGTKVVDTGINAEALANTLIPTVYINKPTDDGLDVSDFRYKNTSRGMVVVLPLKDAEGELLELADKYIKASFWLNLIRDANGVELSNISEFQFYNLCFEYKKSGVVTYAWLNLSLAQGFYKRAQVKDLYGKVNEALIAGNVTWSASVLGASEESPLVSNNQVVDATIELDADTTTYTVIAATPTSIKVSADVVGCSVLLPTGMLEADKTVNIIIPENSESITVGNKTAKAGDTAFCFFDYDNNAWTVNVTSSTVDIVDYSDVFVKDAFKTADLTIAGGGKLTYTSVVPTAAVGELIAFLEVIGSYPSSYFFPGIYKIVQKDTVAKFIRVRKVVDDFSQSSVVRVSAPTYRGMWQSIYSGFEDELPTFERLSKKVDQVAGKGLSANDFTNELKAKYDNQTIEVDNLNSINNLDAVNRTTLYRLPEDVEYAPLNSSLFSIKRIVSSTSWEHTVFFEQATGVDSDGNQFCKYRQYKLIGEANAWTSWANDSTIGNINTVLDYINREVV